MTSLLRSTRTMAIGTVASRGTGFLRTLVIATVLGVAAVGTAFNVANTAPNIVYELLLGGVLSSVVVPLLVRAAKNDSDGGEAYAQRLLSLAVLVLGGAALLLVLLAPAVVDVYLDADADPATRDLAIVFARFFLPQVLFYGAGAVMGAYLNTRGRFGPPMWAPVLNNVVVIVTGLVFLLLPGPTKLTAGSITDMQITVLGIGVTLGIVAQTAALVPALRQTGFRFVPRLDLRGSGLGHAAKLARWVFLLVVAQQAALIVVIKLTTKAGSEVAGRGYPSYVYAFTLWQLPYAIVAVSVITALLPRMSRAAADEAPARLRAILDGGLRAVLVVMVPAAVAFVVLGPSIATLVFNHREISLSEARFIGVLLAVFAFGLVPFSTYQLQMRAFFAQQDTRTPALVSVVVSVTMVVADVILYAALPADLKVAGLAAGQALSYVVGVVLVSRLLVRRTGPGRGRVLQVAARCLAAVLPGALVAVLVLLGVQALLGQGFLGALVAVVLCGAVLAGGYVALLTRMRVPEVDRLLSLVPGLPRRDLGRTDG